MTVGILGSLLNGLIREGWQCADVSVYDQNEGTTKGIEDVEITWRDGRVRVVLTTEY